MTSNDGDDVAGDCTAAISALLVAAGPMDSKHIFIVTDEADLLKQINIGIKTPFAGIIYGGLQGMPGADASRQGRGADIRIAVLYGLATRALGNLDSQPSAWTILKLARRAIIGQVSPTGHKWRFMSESYLGSKNDAAYYTQHWAAFTPIT